MDNFADLFEINKSIIENDTMLKILAHQVWYLTIICLMTSILTNIFIQSLYEIFGVKTLVKQGLLIMYIKSQCSSLKEAYSVFKEINQFTGEGIYSLPYEKLCGLISNSFYNVLESKENFTKKYRNLSCLINNRSKKIFSSEQTNKDDDEENNVKDTDKITKYRLMVFEKIIDELQLYLKNKLLVIDFVLSAIITFILITMFGSIQSLNGNVCITPYNICLYISDISLMYIAVPFSASFSPIINNIIDKIINL